MKTKKIMEECERAAQGSVVFTLPPAADLLELDLYF
jgi:hypothetical protein